MKVNSAVSLFIINHYFLDVHNALIHEYILPTLEKQVPDLYIPEMGEEG